MGTVDLSFAGDLRADLGLQRAVETGTYRGETARALATVFGAVVTIELSRELHAAAAEALAAVPAVDPRQGHSVTVLRELRDPATPTLYFLDGHWSGGPTAGADDECPVLQELEAIAGGHPDDCLIIDDARLFAAAPPPPHRAEMWPTLIEVFDAIRARWPEHLVTVLADQIVAAPERSRLTVDAYGRRVSAPVQSRARALGARLRGRR